LDSTVPPDSVVIVVLDSVRRKPIIGAGARFLPTTSADARADGSGRIALALPAGEHAILEVDAIGFMRRRDTLALGAVRNHKVEAVLAYPTGGDIDVVVCHR
jgi:hypothetical protein